MLNSYHVKGGNTTNKTNINAVSGTLVKNHPNSFFVRFNLKSTYAETVMDKNSHYIETKRVQTQYGRGYRDEETKVPVVVLQLMIVGDMEVVAEIVKKDDYDYVEEVEG